LVGPSGPSGRTGPAGSQGLVGATGAQGSTTIGIAGVAGRPGEAGPQGLVGATGAQGGTPDGIVGVAGPVGEAGPQGPAGETGAQGPTGVVQRWTLYRDFRFDNNQLELSNSENDKVLEVARYIKENPSLKVAIGCSMRKPGSRDMSERRCNAIRAALVKAGVPFESVQIGAYGDKKRMPDGEIALLISSNN
jgi:hypothetical protein